jgi:hypothetical protein
MDDLLSSIIVVVAFTKYRSVFEMAESRVEREMPIQTRQPNYFVSIILDYRQSYYLDRLHAL